MLDYQSTMNLYSRIHKRIWAILFRSNFKHYGKSSRIAFPLKIQNAQYIEIGNHVSILNKAWLAASKVDENNPRLLIEDYARIGHFSHIAAVREVHIGKNVLMADRVYVSDNLHAYEDIRRPIKSQPTIFKSRVYVGDDSWIGESVSIIGAKIGKHCVIGANSVVTKDIPDYCVAVGAPAQILKRYNFNNNSWERV